MPKCAPHSHTYKDAMA